MALSGLAETDVGTHQKDVGAANGKGPRESIQAESGVLQQTARHNECYDIPKVNQVK